MRHLLPGRLIATLLMIGLLFCAQTSPPAYAQSSIQIQGGEISRVNHNTNHPAIGQTSWNFSTNWVRVHFRANDCSTFQQWSSPSGDVELINGEFGTTRFTCESSVNTAGRSTIFRAESSGTPPDGDDEIEQLLDEIDDRTRRIRQLLDTSDSGNTDGGSRLTRFWIDSDVANETDDPAGLAWWAHLHNTRQVQVVAFSSIGWRREITGLASPSRCDPAPAERSHIVACEMLDRIGVPDVPKYRGLDGQSPSPSYDRFSGTSRIPRTEAAMQLASTVEQWEGDPLHVVIQGQATNIAAGMQLAAQAIGTAAVAERVVIHIEAFRQFGDCRFGDRHFNMMSDPHAHRVLFDWPGLTVYAVPIGEMVSAEYRWTLGQLQGRSRAADYFVSRWTNPTANAVCGDLGYFQRENHLEPGGAVLGWLAFHQTAGGDNRYTIESTLGPVWKNGTYGTTDNLANCNGGGRRINVYRVPVAGRRSIANEILEAL